VLVGMLALGEGLPSTRSLGAARLLAWALLIAGVSALASGQGGRPAADWSLQSRMQRALHACCGPSACW